MTEDRLETLRKYDVADIQQFRETRQSAVITPSMQHYILQLDAVAQMQRYNKLSVRGTIEQLCIQFPELSIGKARGIYYDALDYFYMDDSASAHAWDMAYADKLEDLATVAIAANKLETAYKCIAHAHKLRTTTREALDFKWKAPTFIINTSVKPEDLGYKNQKLADIARRAEDKKFLDMINSLDVPEKEKERLLSEAGIKTVNAEETDADEQEIEQ